MTDVIAAKSGHQKNRRPLMPNFPMNTAVLPYSEKPAPLYFDFTVSAFVAAPWTVEPADIRSIGPPTPQPKPRFPANKMAISRSACGNRGAKFGSAAATHS